VCVACSTKRAAANQPNRAVSTLPTNNTNLECSLLVFHVPHTRYTVVGSRTSWWNGSAACSVDEIWGIWRCPSTADVTAVACINAEIPDVTLETWETGTIESHRHIGYVCQRSVAEVRSDPNGPRGEDINRCMPLTKNPITTGLSNRVWFWRFVGGGVASNSLSSGQLGWDASPAQFNITYTQIPVGHFVVVALAYPNTITSADIELDVHLPYHGGPTIVPEAATLDQVLLDTEQLHADFTRASHCPASPSVALCNRSNAGPSWFWHNASGILFVRVVNPAPYVSRFADTSLNARVFERDGMWLNGIDNLAYYRLRVNCPTVGRSGLCAVRRNPLPAAVRPSGDSCRASVPRMMLQGRLDVAITASFAWQATAWSTGPNLTAPVALPVGGVLSLSADTGNVVQVASEAELVACNTASGRLLHDFAKNGSAFDVSFAVAGTYLFTTTDDESCGRGLQLRVVVGTGGNQNVAAPLLAASAVSSMRIPVHATCTVVAGASGTTTDNPTATPTLPPTTVPPGGASTDSAGGQQTTVIATVVAAVAVIAILVAVGVARSRRRANRGASLHATKSSDTTLNAAYVDPNSLAVISDRR
jgi:hypothetical protein